MTPSDVQTNVRLPAELKQWLQDQATAARRSFTQELVFRLEASRQAAQQTQQKGQQQ